VNQMETTPLVNSSTRKLWYFRRLIRNFFRHIVLFALRYSEPDSYMVCEIWRGYGAKIASNVHIDPTCYIDKSYANLLSIHENAVVAMGSAFILHDSSVNNVVGGPLKVGRIIVERNAYIGCYSIILPGTVIGEGSIVGAGSLVIDDVQPGTVVIGRPAIQSCTVKELALRYGEKATESNEMVTFLDFPSQKEKERITAEDLKAWGLISKEQAALWLSSLEK